MWNIVRNPPVSKRTLAVGAAVLLALGLGVAVLPHILLGDVARQHLEQASGGRLSFPKGPSISLWPEARIQFSDATVAGRSPDDPPIATIESLRLKVALAPLLARKLEIEEIVLVRPTLNLLLDGEGKLNVVDDPSSEPSPEAASDTGGLPLIIEGGAVRYRDLRWGREFEASDVDATLRMPATGGAIDLKGYLTWRQRRAEVTLYVRSPGRLASDGSPADLTIAAPDLSAVFSGRMSLKHGLSLVGQVEASSGSLAELADWGGIKLSGIGGLNDLSLSGGLDLDGHTVRFKGTRLGLAGMQAEGDLSLDVGGKRPKLDATLKVDRLDLSVFGGPVGEANALTEGWRDKPVALKGLEAVDADLRIEAGAILFDGMSTDAGSLKARIVNGVLDAELASLSLYGGSGHGQISLDGSSGKAELRGTIETKGIDVQPLLRDFAGLQAISGRGDLSLSLSSVGATQLELVSTLTGDARLSLADGALIGLDVPALVQSGGTGWRSEAGKQTPFSTLNASFAFSDGVADNATFTVKGPNLDILGKGLVDLLRQRIEYGVVVSAPPPPTRVSLEGPWRAPSVKSIGSAVDPDPAIEGKSSRLGGEEEPEAKPVAPQ